VLGEREEAIEKLRLSINQLSNVIDTKQAVIEELSRKKKCTGSAVSRIFTEHINVSMQTVYRARCGGTQVLQTLRSPRDVQCQRLSNNTQTFLLNTVNELLPVSSGRPWRRQRETNQQLYDRYCALAAQHDQEPVSFSYFMHRHLSGLHIHHYDNKMKFCPYYCHMQGMLEEDEDSTEECATNEEWVEMA